MKFLILLSAFAAFAHGAPSGAILPLSALPLTPTISPGDVEAAAINAKVSAEDAAQAAIDQARLLNEQAIEANKEKLNEAVDLTNERSLEAFWSVEDQKWQAVDAAKTVEAKINGVIASNADNLAKAAIATPYLAYPAYAPFLANIPNILIPQSQSISTQSLSQTHPLQALTAVKPELATPVLKLAEPVKPEQPKLELTPNVVVPYIPGFLAPASLGADLKLLTGC